MGDGLICCRPWERNKRSALRPHKAETPPQTPEQLRARVPGFCAVVHSGLCGLGFRLLAG